MNLVLMNMTTDADIGSLTATWQRTFQSEDKVRRSQGNSTLALSAFYLSSLPYPASRKAIVKEMWESGADIMVSSITRDALLFKVD